MHERIAKALGWTVEEARSFSLPALREVVRPVSMKLAYEITLAIQNASIVEARSLGLKVPSWITRN
jgi:hypothetical protein